MDEIRLLVEKLRDEVIELKIAVALLQQSSDRIENILNDARNERTKLATELGVYGIQLTKFISEFSNLTASVADLKPTVQALENDRVAITRFGQFFGAIGKAAWAVIGVIIGAVLAIAGALGLRH